ncbi:MAG: sulfatase-like hydrolase/transferase, partial [Methyloprofundus sp.]|nr:sulfatase-like hydrolase/transferase [Methyloprofundus sp.]
GLSFSSVVLAQANLPFPKTPSASKVGISLQESEHHWRQAANHLPKDAPNIIIFLTDDTGFGNTSTFGGPINTPTLTQLAKEGIKYNAFHTTAICSPTRASLLTGRNHHRVGYGQISEFASDWDGYIGSIPRETATLPQVLGAYGYTSAAFGKWHNTPTTDITPSGPFDQWPTGLGFNYFYGFLAGEAAQYEPMLFENTLAVDYPKTKDYHLTEDLADHAITFMRNQRMSHPDKPFMIYFAPGAVHGPHQVAKKWADKYKGKFDKGWEVLRQETFKRQKAMGVIPANAKLTDMNPSMQKWADIPNNQREFQTRLMEVFAGFLEHTDRQYGRIIDELDKLGIKDNTLVIYINGDNGSSAEGINGSLSELLSQNNMPTTVNEQISVLNNEYGGLEALGGPLLESMYHHGWAWSGSTPFKNTKLVASHFGGTRNPMVISWPAKIKPDTKPRSQFHHVNDIAVTIYDILDITPPDFYNGVAQDQLDGVSLAYTFNDAEAKGQKSTQYFEVMGSRGLYKDGWFAGTFGPRTPWNPMESKIADWNPNNDIWELYNLTEDFSQANDLAKKNPEKLQEMKNAFLVEAAHNKVFPIGGSLYMVAYHPEEIKSSTLTEWHMYEGMTRIHEASAPKFQSGFSTHSNIEVDIPENASGVLYAVGGISAGFTVYMDKGVLKAEYNAMTMNRYKVSSGKKIPTGKVKIEVIVKAQAKKPLAPSLITLKVNGKVVGKVMAETTVPAIFTASETFDVGMDLGSAVALDYHEQVPFKFTGKIEKLTIKYID